MKKKTKVQKNSARVPLLEICVDSVASARAAAQGGADRLEVCANLFIGGTTPSPALVRAIVRETGLGIRALIRPRAGDFLYTDDECEQMCEDIKALVSAGAQGVVIGSLNADGTLCTRQLLRMIDAAGDVSVTLHRAFDMSCDLQRALEDAVELGIDTILTSGGEESARAGAKCMEQLVQAARGRVQILAGAGVNEETIAALYPLGVRAFHLSGKVSVDSGMRYRNPRVHMGVRGLPEYEREYTDKARVRAAKEALCMAYLRASSPMQDALDVSDETLRAIVRVSLRAARELPFASALDPAYFYTYVLQPRVNDERIDAARETLYQALCDQVRGLHPQEAVLRVNEFCAKHVRYAASDGRTRGAQGVFQALEGRCGEESVFLTNALRAVGIAARQVYALWWSHCDDNHAWVEAYVDGSWRYIGACEPEEALDRGWFTSAASRAMLIHTRALGDALVPEDAFYQRGCVVGVNRTHAYARTVTLRVRIPDGAGATVRFLIANSGRLRTLHEAQADAQGVATLETGLGGLYVSVQLPDGREAGRAVDTEKTQEIVLIPGSGMQRSFYLRAPAQTRFGLEAPRVLCAQCTAAYEAHREQVCEQARALANGDAQLSAIYEAARGNAPEIARFMAAGENRDARLALLRGLAQKDLTDVSAQTLEDALDAGAQRLRDGNEQPAPVYQPIRAFFEGRADAPRTAEEAMRFVQGHVEEAMPCGLDFACRADRALAAGRCAAGGSALIARKIVRALGLAPKAQEACVTLTLENPAGLVPQEDYALVRVLPTGGYADVLLKPLHTRVRVQPGDYELFVLARQLDGSIYGHFEAVNVQEGTRVVITPERDQTEALLSHTPLPQLRELGCEGADVVAFIAPGEEPSAHFLLELMATTGCASRRFTVFVRGEASGELLERAGCMENVRMRAMDEAAERALITLREQMAVGDARLPFVIALGGQGEGLYACGNYSVGSVARLVRVLSIDRQGKAW